MRTRMLWAGLLLATLALTATGCRSGIVTYVVDGDTIDVDGRRVRFIGVDTPERGQCGYREAKQRVAQLVSRKRVEGWERLLPTALWTCYSARRPLTLTMHANASCWPRAPWVC